MSRRPCLLIAAAVLLAGCAGSTAVSRHFDRDKIRKLGVVRFEAVPGAELGAGDIFAKHLLKRGFRVVERARIEAVLDEQRLGATGAIPPEAAKELGRLLGVDGLVMGQVTDYQPQRKSVVMTTTHETRVEPVFKKVKRKTKKGPPRWVRVQVSTRTKHSTREVPMVFTIDAQVSLVAKLVDVETGEIVWIGSTSGEGVTPLMAVESAASYLARKLKKEW